MSKTLKEVAEELKGTDKKAQLIYAFNGTGKTRLSREFKELIEPDDEVEAGIDSGQSELAKKKIIYYSAFTEDLFYWDNDLNNDEERKLNIHSNSFTNWVLKDQGQEPYIAKRFQSFTSDKLTPIFSEDFSSVSFSIERGDNESINSIKISKGEESNFIWSVFYSLLEQVIGVLNTPDPEDRETNDFDQLEYVFIDDPVSSLDENHLIELAFILAALIKSSDNTDGKGLKFIISTHSPLFYNVLHNELSLNKKGKREGCYLLEKFEDGKFNLNVKYGDSNKSFSYHLYLKQTLESAVENNQIERYHFMLLRNLYEKAASFLGYPEWSALLDTAPGDKQGYLNRIIQFSSHFTLSNEEIPEPNEQEKQMIKLLLDNIVNNYGFWQEEEQFD